MVGGHHDVKNCIKELHIRKVEATALTHCLQASLLGIFWINIEGPSLLRNIILQPVVL